IGAIRMIVARFAALMALRYDIVGDALAKSVVEYKILTDEFTYKTLFLYLARIFDDAAFKLVYVFETFVLEVRTCLFASDSACTIHQQFFIRFVFRKLLFDNW